MQPSSGRFSLGQEQKAIEPTPTQQSPFAQSLAKIAETDQAKSAIGIELNNNPELPAGQHQAPILVAAYAKNGHVYLFRYHRDRSAELMRHIGQMAVSDETDFSWWDAAKVTQRIRDLNHAADNLVG